jgi:hypothetical protein
MVAFFLPCVIMVHMKMTDEHYNYLIDLRDSGEVNMWSATHYLVQDFGVSYEDAKKILIQYIESFNK